MDYHTLSLITTFSYIPLIWGLEHSFPMFSYALNTFKRHQITLNKLQPCRMISKQKNCSFNKVVVKMIWWCVPLKLDQKRNFTGVYVIICELVLSDCGSHDCFIIQSLKFVKFMICNGVLISKTRTPSILHNFYSLPSILEYLPISPPPFLSPKVLNFFTRPPPPPPSARDNKNLNLNLTNKLLIKHYYQQNKKQMKSQQK